MKKIFKHVCLCLCLVMVGLLFFNAKPKAFGTINTPYTFDIEYYSTPSFIENGDPLDYIFYISSISMSSTFQLNQNVIQLGYRPFSNTSNTLYFDLFSIGSIYNVDNKINDLILEVFSIGTNRYSNNLQNKIIAFSLKWQNFLYDSFNNLTGYSYILSIITIDIEYNSYYLVGDYSFSIPGFPSFILFGSDISYYYSFNTIKPDYETIIGIYESQGENETYLIGDLFYAIEMNDKNSFIGELFPTDDFTRVNILYNYLQSYYIKGVDEGLQIGFEQGIASIENIPGSFLTPIFDFIDNVFNLEVMPNVKIGYFIIIPLIFGVLGVVLYFWRKD